MIDAGPQAQASWAGSGGRDRLVQDPEKGAGTT